MAFGSSSVTAVKRSAFDEVSVKEARQSAAKWREVVRAGQDLIKERKKLKGEAARASYSLTAAAQEAFEVNKAELKGNGKGENPLGEITARAQKYPGSALDRSACVQ